MGKMTGVMPSNAEESPRRSILSQPMASDIPPLPSLMQNAGMASRLSTLNESEDARPAEASPGDTARPAQSESTTPKLPSDPEPVAPEQQCLFLTVGRSTKRVECEIGSLTLASLRLLFTERFNYSCGTQDFPDIYTSDPSTGVEYELEDCSTLKPNSRLMLNIERSSLILSLPRASLMIVQLCKK